MKKIPTALKQKIEDAVNEGLLSLPVQIVEKDIHVTDALRAISEIDWKSETSPEHKPGVNQRNQKIKIGGKLVFAGGTCLSKAYGLIERMSEDIDIKVFLEPIPAGYRSLSDHARLKMLHTTVIATLSAQGFTIAEVEENRDEEADATPAEEKSRSVHKEKNPHIRDGRRFFHLTLDYESVFEGQLGALRPKIKVELIHRHTVLPTDEISFGYLVDRIIGVESAAPVTFHCISVAETLSEKILSMLRRTAWKWYGGQKNEMDPALVRHIYDVGQIVRKQPGSISDAVKIFSRLVNKDAEEFGRQYPEFTKTPEKILADALKQLKTDDEIAKNYVDKLIPLIYSADVPVYSTAYTEFEAVANQLLSSLTHADTSEK